MSNTTERELVWWSVRQNGQQFICTLPDRRSLATVGAHAAHGMFVRFPFEIEGPANEEEIAWAERELENQIESREAEERAREELEQGE